MMKNTLLAFAIALLATRSVHAELYLQMQGVPGSSRDEGRKDWLDVDGFGIGVFTPPDPTPNDPRDSPLPSVTAMRIVGPSSSSSPYLFLGAARGNVHSTMELQIVEPDTRGGTRVRAFWQMEQARITRYETHAQEAGEVTLVTEQYEITPLEILRYGYNFYSPTGMLTETTEVEWNLATGRIGLNDPGAASGFQFLTGDVDVGDLPPANPTGPGGPVDTADFDWDGDVDGADLVEWRGDFGVNDRSDADDDGDSDGADLLAWQRQLGNGASIAADVVSTLSGVPEPAGVRLAWIALCGSTLATRRGRGRRSR